ncbi:MAG: HNH endonuclease, partial [Desulfoarculaceae bacterium]|nr:HNH endonuclease [Desulfoarculaceae bacterium]
IIHPYLDNDRFFIEQWVYAQVIPGNPCSIEYFVCAPEHWSQIDQKRVATHFHDFELAKRYSI